MPWGDWQFWIVTLAMLAALLVLARCVRPLWRLGRKPPSKRAALTVSAKGPRPPG